MLPERWHAIQNHTGASHCLSLDQHNKATWIKWWGFVYGSIVKTPGASATVACYPKSQAGDAIRCFTVKKHNSTMLAQWRVFLTTVKTQDVVVVWYPAPCFLLLNTMACYPKSHTVVPSCCYCVGQFQKSNAGVLLYGRHDKKQITKKIQMLLCHAAPFLPLQRWHAIQIHKLGMHYVDLLQRWVCHPCQT